MAGELVDVDGTCGGYNLQWAWSSGYVAGLHAVIDERQETNCDQNTSIKTTYSSYGATIKKSNTNCKGRV